MDVRERVMKGIRALEAGNLKRAEDIFKSAWKENPNHPDALHFYGLSQHRLNRNKKAEGLIRKSIAIDPDNPSAHSNLGNALRMLGKNDEAMDCYRRALALDPLHPQSLNNIATLQRRAGRFEEAAETLREALKIAPDMAEAYHNLGTCLSNAGKYEEAIEAFTEGFDRGGDWIDPVRVAKLLFAYERPVEAEKLLVEYLDSHPDHAPAQFQLAAIRGDKIDRASDEYVTSHFDDFAGSFDIVLKGLEYRAPALVSDAVAARLGPPSASLDFLDLGCGTGLCGPLIADYKKHLVGIDLSPKMLELAKDRGYDSLHKAELQAFLEKQREASFDVVLCVDTMVYLGVLDRTFAGVAHVLRPGGLFVASVEKLEGDNEDYTIDGSGRFKHSRAYLERLARENGLSVGGITEADLRKETGSMVRGYVCEYLKPGA